MKIGFAFMIKYKIDNVSHLNAFFNCIRHETIISAHEKW